MASEGVRQVGTAGPCALNLLCCWHWFPYRTTGVPHAVLVGLCCPHRSVLFASVLMRKTMASRIRATILFATETGKSEALARDLGILFSCAFNPKVG